MRINTGDWDKKGRGFLVCAEQLQLLYGGIPFAVTAHVLSGFIVTIVLWQVINHSILIAWLTVVCLTSLGRALLGFAYHQRKADSDNFFWYRGFIILAGLSGLTWGSAGLLLFPENDLSYQTFVAFAMVGMATGAVTTQAFLRQSMFVFVIPIMLGIAVGFIQSGTPIGLAIGGAAILLLSVLLISGNRIYRNTAQNIELRLKSSEQSIALEDSERRLRTILDTAADAFFLHDENGRFIDVNQQACLSLGYTREELLNLSVADIETTADKEDVELQWADLHRDMTATVTGFHRRKDGSTFPVEVRLGVLYEGGKKLFSVLVRDITERMKAEEALSLSEEQARAQYKGMPLPTYTWRYQDGDFILDNYNDAAYEFTKGVVKEYLGIKLSEMYAHEPGIISDIHAAYRDRTTIEKEISTYFKHAKLTRQLAMKYAYIPPDMVMIHTEDISARLRAEKEIQDSKRQLEEAQRIARLGNWEWDLVDGKIEWSDEVYHILGYEKGRDTANQENFIRVMHPEDLKLMAESEQRAWRGEPNFDEEWRIITLAGETKYINLRGDRYFDEQNRPIRMVGTMQDITERKQVEVLKNEFVSTVSHEIRTPLTSIMGSLSIMQSGAVGKLSKEADTMVRIAHENSQRLLVLINDILDISRIESGKMAFDLKPLAVDSFLSQAITANQGYAEHHHVTYSLETKIDTQLKVMGDNDRLMQVMNNLLSNAAKFSPHGSAVDISAYEDENRLFISVADRGPGIPADFGTRLFERFTQHDASSKRSAGGTGLGLNISKHIIEKHNGSIGYTDRQGGGSVFYFSLPLMRQIQ